MTTPIQVATANAVKAARQATCRKQAAQAKAARLHRLNQALARAAK